MYDEAFKGANISTLKHFGSDFTSSGHLYMVRLLGKDENYRNIIIEKMAEKGIATNVHYKPLPMHTAYKSLGFEIEDYPNSFDMYRNEITLPLHTLMTDEQVDYVCDNLLDILDV